MSAPPFAHLHCHSHYSLLDGASPIGKLVARAKELGMNSLALTDHGNLHGALEFYQTAKKAGINPILGYEAYIAPDSRSQARRRRHQGGQLSSHAAGPKPHRASATSSSSPRHAFLEGFYFKPRIDKELLAAHSEGLICLSGCVSGEFSRTLLKGAGGAERIWKRRGKSRPGSTSCSAIGTSLKFKTTAWKFNDWRWIGALEVARQMGLPLVATSDAHYVNREDAEAQDVLLCINTGKFRTDTNRMRMEGDQFYLRAPARDVRRLPRLGRSGTAKPANRRLG